ncbi:Gfo/Idh/MocA family oxidoreductase [Aliiglaciecola sp.]|nr:Gfo/Idh/MocA family oxidoreductase [Aliiglaciecola sp.]
MFNWGIIGPGGIAHQFANALAGLNQGRLYAVASRNLQRAQDFACLYDAPISYGDYDRLVDDANIDVVYIATPHSHHFHYAKLCLQVGKHVLMEKPLTVNAKQTQLLVELADKHQVVFQEALWSRYMPCFDDVKSWIKAGKIGDIQYITSQIGFAFSHLRDHRLTRPDLAGGALLDLGVYSVSISQFLLDEHPEKIHAMGVINDDKVDQNTSVNMIYPSGVISQFTCTIGAQCSNVMTIHGKNGYILLPHCFWNGEQAQIFRDGQLVETHDFPHQTNGFEYQIQSTMESIKTARPYDPRMSHNDSINVMQTLDFIRAQIGFILPESIESI